jgi:hypothetical protein
VPATKATGVAVSMGRSARSHAPQMKALSAELRYQISVSSSCCDYLVPRYYAPTTITSGIRARLEVAVC